MRQKPAGLFPPLPPPPRHLQSEAREIRLPISVEEWATLKAKFPITEEEWTRMMDVLEAMKPSLIAPKKPSGEHHENDT